MFDRRASKRRAHPSQPLAAGLALAALALAVHPSTVAAQSAANLAALHGLAPFSALLTTDAGKAALASNLAVTKAIETGTSSQKALLPPADDRTQAIKDAFISAGNGAQLADGYGSKLGAAYQSLASYSSTDDGKTTTYTSVSPIVSDLINYAFALSSGDSSSAKYFFANASIVVKGSASPVSPVAQSIITTAGGTTDVFGKAYNLPAGSTGADTYGDSRPFQTIPDLATYSYPDYFGKVVSNFDYLKGPAQNVIDSPAFPSGHTTYGFTEALILAFLVPERYPQMIARAAEYGNHRIVLGAHYAMDVVGGRALAYYDVAHLLANAQDYVGVERGKISLTDFPAAITAGRSDLRGALGGACGEPVERCVTEDTGRFHDASAVAAFYDATQTYGLPVVYKATASASENVGDKAPEAGYLLTAAFPKLTLAQADKILTQTEGPGGGFLDNGSAFGVYSRLNLYKAALMAQAAM